ncbi:MAG: GAF domain-containing protein [Chloroflexi bacterium]|nr:GAF domain-containing protein [Chloroflexota bacterium]
MTEDAAPEIRLAEQLRRLLQAIEASGHALLPGSNRELLQSIVDAAARIFGAAAASIALVDETRQVLEFKVSYGVGNENVVGMRVPLDQGIAGYVALTGQPMAISNVQQDARFNQGFAQTTGYVPRSILAMPLLLGDRVIGVMEVLDKINAPSFAMQDMELLGLFARQAAIAIDQSQQFDLIGQALVCGLKQLLAARPGSELGEIAEALEAPTGDEARARDLLALADLFNAIGALGEAERQTCLKILRAFAEYGHSRPIFG